MNFLFAAIAEERAGVQARSRQANRLLPPGQSGRLLNAFTASLLCDADTRESRRITRNSRKDSEYSHLRASLPKTL